MWYELEVAFLQTPSKLITCFVSTDHSKFSLSLMLSAKKFGLVPTGLAHILCHNNRAFTLEANRILQNPDLGGEKIWTINRGQKTFNPHQVMPLYMKMQLKSTRR